MYYQKYLKYKTKYLALKNIQKGGNLIYTIPNDGTDPAFPAYSQQSF